MSYRQWDLLPAGHLRRLRTALKIQWEFEAHRQSIRKFPFHKESNSKGLLFTVLWYIKFLLYNVIKEMGH